MAAKNVPNHRKVILKRQFGCTSNSVPMVFVVFSRDSLGIIIHKYPLIHGVYMGISHTGSHVGIGMVGVHPTVS